MLDDWNRTCGSVAHIMATRALRHREGVGKDYTLFAQVDGVVKFERRGKNGKKISVYPSN